MTENQKKYYELGGGFVRRDKSIYVERPQDEELKDFLVNDYGFINLVGSRQTGKSSMAQGIELATKDHIMVFLDFRNFNKGYYEPVDWFRELFFSISEELDISMKETRDWYIGNIEKTNSKMIVDFVASFIRKIHNISKPIIFIFDEIDLLMSHGYHTDDFFYGLFLLYDRREELKISILTVGVMQPKFLFKNRKLSSFKIGRLIMLPDFSTEENILKCWMKGLKASKQNRMPVIQEIFRYTGGHPYLTVQICHLFNEKKGIEASDVEGIVDYFIKMQMDPFDRNPHFDNPKDFITDREGFAYRVLAVYRKTLGRPRPIESFDETELSILMITGLIRVSDHKITIRNRIYEKVFNEKWVDWLEKGLGRGDWYEQMVIPSQRKRRTKPLICVINTGGTIGMVEIEGKMVPPESGKHFMKIYPNIREIADIELISPMIKDSANMFHKDWKKIAQAIYDRRNDGYKGFVVAHGTDTMAYSASAVAFALGPGLDLPVVFTGSQAPHNVAHGDAHANLARACMVATQQIPEVVIVYSDQVLRAVRSEKKDDYRFEGFHSPAYRPIATIAERIELDAEWRKEHEAREAVKPPFKLKNEFDLNVLQIVQYPGIRPDLFEEIVFDRNGKRRVSAVVIQSLGLGNLPNLDKYSFLDFIENLTDYRIPVIVTSKYPIQPEFAKKYVPASGTLEKGAISAGNMTGSAAFTKLSWLLPQIDNRIESGDIKSHHKLVALEKEMKISYVGELDKILDSENGNN